MAGDISKLFSVVLIVVGSSIIASTIGILAKNLMNPPGGWYKQLIQEEENNHFRKIAEETEGWIDDVYVYTKMYVSKGWVRSVLALISWLVVGALYGTQTNQRMSFVTGLYFAVSSVSTGGLESIKLLGDDTPSGDVRLQLNEFPGGNWFFLTGYLMGGIPLYAWALTEIASFFTRAMHEKWERDTLCTQISEDEFQLMDFLGNFNARNEDAGEVQGDGEIDMFEFVECQLLRLGNVSVTALFDIKARFIELDLDGGGTIEREELIGNGAESDDRIVYALAAMEKLHSEMVQAYWGASCRSSS